MVNLSTGQLFARKLIRPFADFTKSELRNELRAVEKICTKNHRNIVTVFKHGHLSNSHYFHIDMELCHMNLEDYLKREQVSTSNNRLPIFSIWTIMKDIASGLSFIHSSNEVHRDLKPPNGKTRFILGSL